MMPAKPKLPPDISACAECGAPRGERVVRRRADHTKWALDLELHDLFPEAWSKAVTVRLMSSGKCRLCDSSCGGDQ